LDSNNFDFPVFFFYWVWTISSIWTIWKTWYILVFYIDATHLLSMTRPLKFKLLLLCTSIWESKLKANSKFLKTAIDGLRLCRVSNVFIHTYQMANTNYLKYYAPVSTSTPVRTFHACKFKILKTYTIETQRLDYWSME